MSNLAVLIEAVKNGDEQGLLAGLRRDPSLLSDTDKTGSTLLHHAALSSSAAIVSLLLSRGADPGSFNDFTQLPLHWAAAAGNLGTATVLVQRGGINQKEGKGMTPLMLAAKRGNQDVVRLLLSMGGDPRLADSQGKTARAHAEDPDLKTLLARAEQQVGSLQRGSVHSGSGHANGAAQGGGSDLLSILQRGDEGTALAALSAGDVDVAARVPASGATALLLACERGMDKVVAQLIARQADLDLARWDGATPLLAATRKQMRNAVKSLVEAGAQVDKADLAGCTPLIEAATLNDAPLVALLLRASAKPDLRNGVGETALMRACVHQDASAAEVLLVGGANLNVVETDLGFSPLMFAASQGSAPVVKLLLQRGALVNAKSKAGIAALHLAARSGHVGVVKLLIQHGAELDILEQNSFTPLMLAAMGGHLEVVELLINAGADATAVSSDGYTALSAASEFQHQAVVALLLQMGVTAAGKRSPSLSPGGTGRMSGNDLGNILTSPGPSPTGNQTSSSQFKMMGGSGRFNGGSASMQSRLSTSSAPQVPGASTYQASRFGPGYSPGPNTGGDGQPQGDGSMRGTPAERGSANGDPSKHGMVKRGSMGRITHLDADFSRNSNDSAYNSMQQRSDASKASAGVGTVLTAAAQKLELEKDVRPSGVKRPAAPGGSGDNTPGGAGSKHMNGVTQAVSRDNSIMRQQQYQQSQYGGGSVRMSAHAPFVVGGGKAPARSALHMTDGGMDTPTGGGGKIDPQVAIQQALRRAAVAVAVQGDGGSSSQAGREEEDVPDEPPPNRPGSGHKGLNIDKPMQRVMSKAVSVARRSHAGNSHADEDDSDASSPTGFLTPEVPVETDPDDPLLGPGQIARSPYAKRVQFTGPKDKDIHIYFIQPSDKPKKKPGASKSTWNKNGKDGPVPNANSPANECCTIS